MNSWLRPGSKAFRVLPFLTLVLASVVVSPAAAQLQIQEPGFTVHLFPDGVGAKQAECSPGGIWGDYVYIADSAADRIDRIDVADNPSVFAIGLSFPTGMAFGPGPGSNFGDYIYVCNFNNSTISKVSPAGVVTAFTNIAAPGANVFDPTGTYGNDMLVSTAFSGPISKVDDTGTASVFSTLEATYLKFGPGGGWGSGLYSTGHGGAPGIYTVATDGSSALFVGGYTTPEGFDWAFGPGWDGDMFSTDVTTGEIWRVKSDGTRTLWATVPQPADVAFCNGALYVVTLEGKCFRVTASQGSAAVRQDLCESWEEDGTVFLETHFTLINIDVPVPVCGMLFIPEPNPATPECSIIGCTIPEGWSCEVQPDGGARWTADGPAYCVNQGQSLDGFSYLLDPGFCCYVVQFFDETGAVIGEQEECFCDKPTPTQDATWGSIKGLYR